ncbi:nucleoside monophosphate kinase [Leptolyngbya cf. ectocarpi LEGE 11479]|uniref:Adenylate kinase n=1 Tax=Leptolyngbya cf. ectocarpi LEGE 11479 TaxID=1828722 RepID=A0A929FCC0_LEPEC|nr:nucleoside monophosphate kinase [Leptolyngbya ectocarpi]MBE9069428.1 nucleoside monophosphate kinase [Leptolyngbya cf. ectocarpi LEGE 11479]
MEFKQLILLGPPGADVREHAIALSQRWHIPHVSMGQLVREAIAKESAVGLEARPYVEAGELVPDALVMKLLRKRFEQPDVMLKGWILDGFPRTLAQAEGLNQLLSTVGQPAAAVAYLKMMTGLLIDRLTAAGGHEPIPAIRSRLNRHKEETAPLLEYYRQQQQLTIINASRSGAEVTQALAELFEEETGAARFIRNESELDFLIEKESLLVVDCMASWCGSCKLVTPLIDQLAEAYSERVNVMKIDFDANKQVPKRFGLKGMPAVMFFKDGELIETLTGVKPYQAYNAALTRFLE